MCMIDWADGYWHVFSATNPRASRPYKCGECNREIAAGERYENARGVHSEVYGWQVYRTCEHCVAARSWLLAQCDGWLYEGVHEDLLEHWYDEPLLRTPWLGRAIIGMRNQWQRKGALMPVLPLYTTARVA